MSHKFIKVVNWSEKQRCYIGSVPALSINGVHGKNPDTVMATLCQLAQVWESVGRTSERRGRV